MANEKNNVEAPTPGDPREGVIHKPELLDRGLELHKAEDGVKSSRAEKAEGEWVAEKRDELASDDRSFGKRH